MSKSHTQQWEVNEVGERPDAELVAALGRFPTTQISDSGAPVSVLGPGLRPVTPTADFCGPAVTLWTRPGDILFVLKCPDVVRSGDVVVIDGGGRLDAAVIGDIVGGMLRDRGVAGLVVDGAVRDVDGLTEIGLPVIAAGTHPATGSNQGPGALNVPVTCAGSIVRPGDIVRADASGVVIVPAAAAEQVVGAAAAVDEREQGWRKEVADGGSLTPVLDLDATIRRGSAGSDPNPAP